MVCLGQPLRQSLGELPALIAWEHLPGISASRPLVVHEMPSSLMICCSLKPKMPVQ